jgi:hypothetical protein
MAAVSSASASASAPARRGAGGVGGVSIGAAAALALALALALGLPGADAYAKGDVIKVLASHVGPVNNPSEVRRRAGPGRLRTC